MPNSEVLVLIIFYAKKKKKFKSVRNKPHAGRKIFAKDTPDKWLFSKIYKEYLEINNRKTNIPIKKWVKTLPDTLPEKMYRWQIKYQKCSILCVFREMQIKTTVSYYYISIRMVKTPEQR